MTAGALPGGGEDAVVEDRDRSAEVQLGGDLDDLADERDPACLASLAAATFTDSTGLVRCGRAELDRAGGPLDEGYARYA
ncbi:hypothetical protein [Actinomycetospora sp.]|jgi:hypothetical protein|uniref:hypothetical protein n=1 Tax=Actinomycetospora sp. TaxID=1872135 RepID=UPI002F401BF7